MALATCKCRYNMHSGPLWKTPHQPESSLDVMSTSTLQTSASHALFGLDVDNPAASLSTCVLELFDNALDATSSNTAGRIDVSLERAEPAGMWLVRVADDGRGFCEETLRANATELFVGSKGGSRVPARGATATASSAPELPAFGSASAGAFGIGLKAVMMWAHTSATQAATEDAVEIRTTTLAAPTLSILRVRLEARSNVAHPAPVLAATRLQPIIAQTSIAKPDGTQFSGTVVIALLQGGPTAVERIVASLECAAAFLTATALTVSVRVPEALPRCVHVARAPLEEIYTADARGVAPPALPGVHVYLGNWLERDQHLRQQRHPQLVVHDSDAGRRQVQAFGEGAAVLNASSTVHATVLLAGMATETPLIAADRRNPDRHTEDRTEGSAVARRPASAPTSARVAVALCPAHTTLVFLNNKLLGAPDDPLAPHCASYAALQRVKWRRACGLNLQPSTMALTSSDKSSDVRGVYVALHLRSSSDCPLVRFGDLGKRFVRPTKPLVSAIAKALERALEHAHASLAAQGCVLARRERQAREDAHFASAIARSIGGIVGRSRDDSLLRECCDALRLDEDSEDDGREAAIAAALLKHLERDWGDVLERRDREGGADGVDGEPVASARGGSDGGARPRKRRARAQADAGRPCPGIGAPAATRESDWDLWNEPGDDETW